MTDIIEITRRAIADHRPSPPSDKVITLLMKQKLAQQVMGEMSPLTYAQKIAQQALDDATHVDPAIRIPAREKLLDRVEGKVTVPVGNDPSMPFQFERIERLIVDPRLIEYVGGTDTQN